MKGEALTQRLRTLFIGELEEQVALMNTELLALEADFSDADRLRSLLRVAHTLKGAARAVEIRQVERICHALESLVESARDGRIAVDANLLELLYAAADALAQAGRLLQSGDLLDAAQFETVMQALQHGRPRAPEGPLARAREPQRAVSPGQPMPSPGAPGLDVPPTASQLRIDSRLLDALVAATARLDTARMGIADRQGDLQSLRALTRSLDTQMRQLAFRLRRLEKTPSARRLRDALSSAEDDLRLMRQLTARLAAGYPGQARALEQATRDVTERARELHLRPFSEACEGLPRAARDLADAAGRQIRLEIRGGDVMADRTVLDRIRDAVLQLVRNAVDHGIEHGAVRQRAGKPPAGVITVAAELVGDRLRVSVEDDGGGLDLNAIRTQLLQRGRAVPADDAAVARSIFEAGLSTRDKPTTISGRGVGLDVVRHTIEAIGGTVDVTWETGRGTRFVLTCPPTLATLRAVLVSVGSVLLAFPTAAVERLVRAHMADVRTAEGQRMLTGVGSPVPLVPLGRLLPGLVSQPQDPLTVIITAAAGRRVGLVVDEMLAEQEIVVRPLDERAAPSVHLSGAALLGAGRLALVLNPASIASVAGDEVGAGDEFPATPRPGEEARTVLVVDDSITTRTLEQSILAAAGYRVLTAVDGADGWRRLQEHGADLVVADVEMPGMDGFALCEAIRKSPRFSGLPLILVTSLESAEHRARGMEAGADAYIAKSAFDQTSLLETVRQLLG